MPAVTVFFFTYCVFELPSNLLLKKLRPSRWLPLIMVAWGIVMVSFELHSSSRSICIDIEYQDFDGGGQELRRSLGNSSYARRRWYV